MLDDLPTLRVLIISSDLLSRAGLVSMVNAFESFEVVGQLAGDPEWPQAADQYQPDILIWDMGWEASEDLLSDWQDAPAPLTELTGEIPLLILLSDELHASAAWSLNPKGLLLRDFAPQRLLPALVAVSSGLIVLDSQLPLDQIHPFESLSPPSTISLTPREGEVLQLVSAGLSNRAIAVRLSISEHTVKFHVNAIMDKLGAQSRTDAVVRATRMGLIML